MRESVRLAKRTQRDILRGPFANCRESVRNRMIASSMVPNGRNRFGSATAASANALERGLARYRHAQSDGLLPGQADSRRGKTCDKPG